MTKERYYQLALYCGGRWDSAERGSKYKAFWAYMTTKFMILTLKSQ